MSIDSETRRLRLSITQKFMGYLFLLSILPIFAVGLASITTLRDTVMEEARESALQIVSSQVDYLDVHTDQVESLIANILSIEAITDAVAHSEMSDDAYTNLATRARIGYVLNGYLNVKGLIAIDVLGVNGIQYHIGETLNAIQTRQDVRDKLFAAAVRDPSGVYWAGIEDNINGSSHFRKVITIAKIIEYFDRNNLKQSPAGLIVLSFNAENLSEHFSKSGNKNGGYFLIVDDHDRLIYHQNSDFLGMKISKSLSSILRNHDDSYIATIENRESLATARRADRSGWLVAWVVPLDDLNRQLSAITNVTTSVMLVCFCVVALTAWSFSHRVGRPISLVTSRFQQLRNNPEDTEGRLSVRGNDDISDLMRWFNIFLDSLEARRVSDEALRNSEELHRLVLEHTPVGIFHYNHELVLTYTNHTFSQIVKAPAEALLGSSLKTLSDTCFLPSLAAPLDRESGHYEGPYQTSAHAPAIQVSMRCEPIVDTQGRILGGVAIVEDITDRKAAQEHIEFLAHFDALTHLPNRVLLRDRGEQALRYAQRSGLKVAVLFLDLDRFKAVNDTMGHHAGDRLLQAVAGRLKTCVRASDTVCRQSGDEFVLLIDGFETTDTLRVIADKLLHQFTSPFLLGEHEASISCSIGIAVYPDYCGDFDDMLKKADVALYKSKDSGRGTYRFFTNEMDIESIERIRVESHLRRNLKKNEFHLVYQPKMRLSDRSILGVEVLLRWNSPDLGAVPPDHFIPIAEDAGLIVDIGTWVLREACRQAQDWRSKWGRDLSIAINVSARQLKGHDLVGTVARVLEETGLPPEGLELEITESTLIDDMDRAIDVLNGLRSLGVQLSIDDFGTGFSSLRYLRLLPVNTLKIDRSFVHNVAADPDNAAIVRAVVQLGHSLKLAVLAEGVELASELSFLVNEGCDVVQGFYIARPMPGHELEAWISAEMKNQASGSGVSSHADGHGKRIAGAA